MKPQSLSTVAIAAIMLAGLSFMLAPAQVARASTFGSVTTISVIGWLAPDGAHWNTGIPLLILALAGVALFSMMARFFDLKNVGVFALIGLVAGSLFGILSLGGTTSGNFVPFGLIVIAGVDLILYLVLGGD